MHARESIRAQQTSAHTQSVPCRCFTLTLGSPQGQLIGHKECRVLILVTLTVPSARLKYLPMKPPELGYRLRSALAGYVSGIRTCPFARVELRPCGGPHDESRVKPWQDSRGHLHYIIAPYGNENEERDNSLVGMVRLRLPFSDSIIMPQSSRRCRATLAHRST